MPIGQDKYFIRDVNNDQQAVVLYTDGSTIVWDRVLGMGTNSNGDQFDYYCNNLLGSGYRIDAAPTWVAPADPPNG